MQGFLRLFPLHWVVFPDEQINLHVFEPRYRQLIGECEDTKEPFGIPFYKEGVSTFGTLVEVESIKRKYPDGRMDISARGLEPFELHNFVPIVEGRLYPGGKVKSLPVSYAFDEEEARELMDLMESFFELIGSRPDIDAGPDHLSFAYGHKIGLSAEQELELLVMSDEASRQGYLIEHLKYLIPTLQQVEITKDRIRMNGHFKNFDPIKF